MVTALHARLALPCAGIGFLFSWVFGFWYALGSLLGGLFDVGAVWLVFQSVSVLTLVVLGALRRHLMAGASARIVACVGAAAMAVGSLLLMLSVVADGLTLSAAARLVVGAVLGMSQGSVYLVWAHALVRLEPLTAEVSIPLTGVATVACILFGRLLPLPGRIALLVALPVLSAVCVCLLARDDVPAEVHETPLSSLDWSYLARAAVLLVVLRAIVGVPAGIPELTPTSFLSYLGGAALATLLGLAPLLLSMSTGSGGLFRWAGALAGTGALLLLDQVGWVDAGLFILRAASFFVSYLALIHMVNLYQRSPYQSSVTCAVLLASLGLGDILGRVLGMWAGAWTQGAQACLIGLVVVLLFLLALFVPRFKRARTSGDDLSFACARVAAARGLSAREEQILGYLARGRSRPYIRDELSLSINTINTYTRKLYQKLDVHSQQEVIDLVERNR